MAGSVQHPDLKLSVKTNSWFLFLNSVCTSGCTFKSSSTTAGLSILTNYTDCDYSYSVHPLSSFCFMKSQTPCLQFQNNKFKILNPKSWILVFNWSNLCVLVCRVGLPSGSKGVHQAMETTSGNADTSHRGCKGGHTEVSILCWGCLWLLAKWKGWLFSIFSPYYILVIMTLSSSQFLAVHGWHVLCSAPVIPLPGFIKVLQNHPWIAGLSVQYDCLLVFDF